jgi:hypothetical protein
MKDLIVMSSVFCRTTFDNHPAYHASDAYPSVAGDNTLQRHRLQHKHRQKKLKLLTPINTKKANRYFSNHRFFIFYLLTRATVAVIRHCNGTRCNTKTGKKVYLIVLL